jgi:hypothetical protein
MAAIAISTRPTVMRFLPGARNPPIAIPARTQLAPPNDISRMTIVHKIRPPLVIAPGK